jgi:hypothetical protein
LIKHNENARAKKLASDYFERLQELDKKVNSPAVKTTKEKVFRYATLGDWHDKPQKRDKALREKTK